MKYFIGILILVSPIISTFGQDKPISLIGTWQMETILVQQIDNQIITKMGKNETHVGLVGIEPVETVRAWTVETADNGPITELLTLAFVDSDLLIVRTSKGDTKAFYSRSDEILGKIFGKAEIRRDITIHMTFPLYSSMEGRLELDLCLLTSGDNDAHFSYVIFHPSVVIGKYYIMNLVGTMKRISK
jgi:hypothetical protein